MRLLLLAVALSATVMASAATPGVGVPFIGKFGQVFAGPDDPFPGEDVRSYCSVMSQQYSTFLMYRDDGRSRVMVKQVTWKVLNQMGVDRAEMLRYSDQIDDAYDLNQENDTQTWADYGQNCMDRRLSGSWYSYDWKKDKDYPKPYDPLTQNSLPKEPQ